LATAPADAWIVAFAIVRLIPVEIAKAMAHSIAAGRPGIGETSPGLCPDPPLAQHAPDRVGERAGSVDRGDSGVALFAQDLLVALAPL
jgi:hypothetical protein